MDAQVIPFKAKEQKPEIKQGKSAFYCMACNCESFFLFDNGSVECAGCAATMGNIYIHKGKS